ncbi:uncharacterized protein [Epargyreus clarus]|uniref:uncharacterized protein n=1 Tax=Epargyreus clarus TaxID=520877 RepID=UPI003C2FDB75
MWKGITKCLFLSLTVSRIRGHLPRVTNQLYPVQGLFVKPSVDGTTGDLYVAATEDHGVDTHWLTDQPVNFLPTAAATSTKPTTVPVSFSSSFSKTSSPHEESVMTQKRAIITSPQLKYTYALPSSEGSPIPPYPYVAVPVASTDGSAPPCSSEGTPALPSYPQFSPFHYFYPQMMAAMANAMTAVNDGDNEKGFNPPAAPPFWPHAYSYPYQYVMVDPTLWAQAQASATTPPSASSEETA